MSRGWREVADQHRCPICGKSDWCSVSSDGTVSRFVIPAPRFAGLTWAMEKLGPRAILNPDFATKDHARAAIQHLSSDIEARRVYTHTEWRKLDEQWMFLHGGGAIGPVGPLDGIEMDLPPSLALFRLPHPLTDGELREAIHASLSLLDLGPDHITVPLLAAVFRSVLGVRPIRLGSSIRFSVAEAWTQAGCPSRNEWSRREDTG